MMSRRSIKYIIITLLILTISISCQRKRRAFLFYNASYYSIFTEKFELFNTARKKLNRDFFQVYLVPIPALSSLNIELVKLLEEQKDGVFFIDGGLNSLLFKKMHQAGPEEKLPDMRVITYNIPADNEILDPRMPIFNVLIDHNIMAQKLISLLQEYTDMTSDLSDCGIIYDPDYAFCNNTINNMKEAKTNISAFEANGNFKRIKSWLKTSNKKVVVFFGYKSNAYILDLVKKEDEERIYIEVLSEYSSVSKAIDYNISLDWNFALKSSFVSEEYKEFLKQQKKNNLLKDATGDEPELELKPLDDNTSDLVPIKIHNYIVQNPRSVIVKKNRDYSKILTVTLDTGKKIKEFFEEKFESDVTTDVTTDETLKFE